MSSRGHGPDSASGRLRPGWTGGCLALAGLIWLILVPAVRAQDAAVFTLYFPHPERPVLVPEKRTLSVPEPLTERIIKVVRALEDGPRRPLDPALPPGRRIRQVFVGTAGTAYVDLTTDPEKKTGQGVIEESLCLWAIVNTLCDNFTEIQAVKILLGGDEAPALGGHLDISRPLFPNTDLVDKDDGL